MDGTFSEDTAYSFLEEYLPQSSEVGRQGSHSRNNNGAKTAGSGNYVGRLHRTYVTLTYAQTSDGFMGGPQGSAAAQVPISGADSLVVTHALRATHDAILVGISTLLGDNPSLTTRFVTYGYTMRAEELTSGVQVQVQGVRTPPRSPTPVVLDPNMRLFTGNPGKTIRGLKCYSNRTQRATNEKNENRNEEDTEPLALVWVVERSVLEANLGVEVGFVAGKRSCDDRSNVQTPQDNNASKERAVEGRVGLAVTVDGASVESVLDLPTGVRVLAVDSPASSVGPRRKYKVFDLEAMLEGLHDALNVRSVMVEGGRRTLDGFLEIGRADAVVVTVGARPLADIVHEVLKAKQDGSSCIVHSGPGLDSSAEPPPSPGVDLSRAVSAPPSVISGLGNVSSIKCGADTVYAGRLRPQ